MICRFGQSVYFEADRSYTRNIAIQLPMRSVTFENNNTVACTYEIWQSAYSRDIIIGDSNTTDFYLIDGTYTLVANAIDPHYSDNIIYITTSTGFRVIAGMSNIGVILNTYEEQLFQMTFICRSSYTGIVISIEDYLKIYLNETPIIGYTANVYSKDIFILTIKDKFDNELWNGSITYSRTITKSVDMRVFTFTNRETQITTMTILQSGSSGHLFYPLQMLGSVQVYLKD